MRSTCFLLPVDAAGPTLLRPTPNAMRQKEHRVPNDHSALGQKRPLASKLLVLFLD
jgi:hypothetical protein